MVGRLSAAEVERYERDGYLFPIGALEAERAEACREHFEAYETAQTGKSSHDRHHRAFRYKPHLLLAWLDALVREPAILDAVESLIGPDLLVWSSSFFVKEAHDVSFVSWHQDSTTYGLVGDELVTAWVALTDSGIDNACMRVLPGTQALGDLPHRDTDDPDNALSRGETVDLLIDEARAVPITLRAGQMSLHHLRVVHSSPPNGSGRRRIGYAIRYLAPSMRAAGGLESALLVRGTDRHGHFEPEPRPVGDFDPAAVAAYERAVGLRMARVYGTAGETR